MAEKKAVQAALRIRSDGDGISLQDAAAPFAALRAASGLVALSGRHLNEARVAGASQPFDVCIWPVALPPLDTAFWALAAGIQLEASEVIRRVRTRAKLQRAVQEKVDLRPEPIPGSERATAPRPLAGSIDPEPIPDPLPGPQSLADSAPADTLGRLTVGVVPGGPAQLKLTRRQGPLTAVARTVSTGLLVNEATSATGQLTLDLPQNTTDAVDANGKLRLTWNNVYDVLLLDGAFEPLVEGNRVEVFRVSL